MTPLLPDDFVGKCVKHFTHACEKHPKFINALLPTGIFGGDGNEGRRYASYVLDDVRKNNERIKRNKEFTWCEAAHEYLFGAVLELAYGRTPEATEELYDLIAVCLRTICVLEGKQELTKEVCE